MCVRALNIDGLTAHMHSGAYRVPTPLLTTSVMDDIALIHEVVGVGEIAVSDSRSSVPSFDELARIASDARVRMPAMGWLLLAPPNGT